MNLVEHEQQMSSGSGLSVLSFHSHVTGRCVVTGGLEVLQCIVQEAFCVCCSWEDVIDMLNHNRIVDNLEPCMMSSISS